jgi:hypothetical protein
MKPIIVPEAVAGALAAFMVALAPGRAVCQVGSVPPYAACEAHQSPVLFAPKQMMPSSSQPVVLGPFDAPMVRWHLLGPPDIAY